MHRLEGSQRGEGNLRTGFVMDTLISNSMYIYEAILTCKF